uniref:Uncharacterized protein n=1 Tax=Parascaris univalens TaxID=6257 RepID=A0A915BNP3_PARUN
MCSIKAKFDSEAPFSYPLIRQKSISCRRCRRQHELPSLDATLLTPLVVFREYECSSNATISYVAHYIQHFIGKWELSFFAVANPTRPPRRCCFLLKRDGVFLSSLQASCSHGPNSHGLIRDADHSASII